MTDSVAQRIESLAAQLEGLRAAADALAADPSAGTSLRRIARSLESAASHLGLAEIAAGAVAIQRAADAHLERSVRNFLARTEDLRGEHAGEEATILVVEDSKTVAAMTRAYLDAPGRTILLAESAAEAEAVLAERPVDVVILDLILPDRDGRDVLVEMREREATAITPVIVLSSTAGAVAQAECLAVGADDFIEKPADPKTLRSAVARQIKEGRERLDAIRDGLTGLLNRVGIRAAYDTLRRDASETGEPMCVAVVAIDALREVARSMGGDAADRFLLEVSAALHEAIGGGGRLGRWETAELVAILPGHTPDEGRAVLDAVLSGLADDEAMHDFVETGIDIGLTAGITRVDPEWSMRDAIDGAERSLLHAKVSAGDAVRTDDEIADLGLVLRRVLVVEDDRVTSTLVRHRLVRDGHDVVAFENGREALEWATSHDFDLAILDVKVPGMDGFELLTRLREIQRYAEVPIVMLTGLGREADVIRGLELGADDYMLKPFSPTELLARVRRLLHAHTVARPGASARDGS